MIDQMNNFTNTSPVSGISCPNCGLTPTRIIHHTKLDDPNSVLVCEGCYRVVWKIVPDGIELLPEPWKEVPPRIRMMMIMMSHFKDKI